MAAENEDPFATFDPSSGESGFNVKPFGAKERIIINNFFDTNDAARKKYLKQLGYEFDPSDEEMNMIRPIGSKGDWIEIDPGFSDVFKKGGMSALRDEIFQDTGDILYDISDVGAKVISAGGGALAGIPTGGVTSIPLAIAGAAAAGAASSTIKQNVRQMFLDDDIPFDLKEAAVESALSAGGAAAFKYGAKGLKALGDFNLTRRIDGIKNAIKTVGSLSDPDLVERAARHPEMFTKEAVEGGSKRLNGAYKSLFGLEPEEFATQVKDFDSIPTDSLFGKQIAPLKKLANEETQNLSMNAGANVKYSDMMEKLQGAYFNLEQAMLNNPTSEVKEAFGVMKDQLKNLKGMAERKATAAGSKINATEFDYGQARTFLKGLQDAAFVQGPYGTKSTNPIIAGVAGESRKYLDNVAKEAGSQLPDLNSHMHGIFEDFSKAQSKLTPQSVMNAYVGGSTPGSRMKADEIQGFISNLDEKYGSDLAKEFDATSAQAAFENVYKGAAHKGSSRVNAFMLGEMADGALKGMGLGGMAGSVAGNPVAGALLGGATGAVKGARDAAAIAVPEVGLKKLGGLLEEQAARDLGGDPLQELIKSSIGTGASAGALSQATQVEGNSPEEVDPFADLMP